MIEKIVAFKTKDGSIYEDKLDAVNEAFSLEVYDFFETEEKKYEIITKIIENTDKFLKIINKFQSERNEKTSKQTNKREKING